MRLQRALRGWAALAACLAAAGALCAAPVTVVDDRGRSVVLPTVPQRVISLLPSLTEIVCALPACRRLVGVDSFSSWPDSIAGLPRLGGLEDTQVERIVSLKPDLVLTAVSSRATDRLEALGLRVLTLEPKSLADTQRVINAVAQALGEGAAGAALWQRLDARIAAAAARVPAALHGQTVYVEVASAPYAAGEASFVGEMLARLGMANVVPAALGPFPKLNPEFVVRAQPQIVMASARTVADMPTRPGWQALRALRDGRTCSFQRAAWETLVRPGPRLADGADAVADCLVGLAAASKGSASAASQAAAQARKPAKPIAPSDRAMQAGG